MSWKIKEAFRDLHAPLSAEEKRILREEIIAHGGARDPIMTWRSFIADGHNRYEICEAEGLPYETKPLDSRFSQAEEVEEWIIRNQLGRRNLTAERFTYFLGKLYNAEKQEVFGDKKGASSVKVTDEKPAPTAEKIANEAGVSEKTVRKAGKVAEAVDTMPKALKEGVLSGEVKATDKAKLAFAKAEPEKQQEAARAVRTGQAASLDEALGFKKPKAEPKSATPAPSEDNDPPPFNETWNSSLESFCRSVSKAFEVIPSGEWLDDNRVNIARGQIKSALATIRQAKVYGLCPQCEGKGCKSCRKTGWMPKVEFESHGGKCN